MEDLKCPVCHKTFIVPNKRSWAYKKMSQLICSWTCLRTLEKEKGEGEKRGMKPMIPTEVKDEAVQWAIDGGDPIALLAPYTKNPKANWSSIKAKLKETDPETYAKLPDLRNTRKPAKEEEPVKETKADELPKITSPVVYDGMIVREVEGLFGRYRRTDVHDATYIDFEIADSIDIMSYTVDQWRKFLDELEKSSKILGVEL